MHLLLFWPPPLRLLTLKSISLIGLDLQLPHNLVNIDLTTDSKNLSVAVEVAVVVIHLNCHLDLKDLLTMVMHQATMTHGLSRISNLLKAIHGLINRNNTLLIIINLILLLIHSKITDTATVFNLLQTLGVPNQQAMLNLIPLLLKLLHLKFMLPTTRLLIMTASSMLRLIHGLLTPSKLPLLKLLTTTQQFPILGLNHTHRPHLYNTRHLYNMLQLLLLKHHLILGPLYPQKLMTKITIMMTTLTRTTLGQQSQLLNHTRLIPPTKLQPSLPTRTSTVLMIHGPPLPLIRTSLRKSQSHPTHGMVSLRPPLAFMRILAHQCSKLTIHGLSQRATSKL